VNQSNFDLALFNHAVDVDETINIDFFGAFSVDPNAISGSGKAFPFSTGQTYLQITDARGMVLVKSRNLENSRLPANPEDLKKLFTSPGSRSIFTTLEMGPNHSPYRMISYRSTDRGGISGRPSYVLQIAVPATLLEQSRTGLLTFFFIGIPLTLLISALGGLFLSQRALKPVATIIEKIHNLNVNNLTERLPLPPTRDEIRELSLAFNELLERLERAFQSQERFIADASHELKTPIAILRGELDLLKIQSPSPEKLKEFFSTSASELNYLGRILEDLLTLARVEAGAASLVIETVRLDEILIELVATRPLVQINLFGENFEVKGDAVLLTSLFKNLIDNALKFSEPGTKVEVILKNEGDRVSVRVSNQGDPIPAERVKNIFERFYRVPGTSKPGAGLGLAIVKKIADAHGAQIRVASTPDGLTHFNVEMKRD
jgi:signal transduction histidine kinase